MELMRIRRRMMEDAYWTKIYRFNSSHSTGAMLEVTEGQTLVLEWYCPNGNKNGWVMNGYDYCTSIRRIGMEAGRSGRQTVPITATGSVRIGSYSANSTFAVQRGTIKVRVIDP